jgi:hypothetical protein
MPLRVRARIALPQLFLRHGPLLRYYAVRESWLTSDPRRNCLASDAGYTETLNLANICLLNNISFSGNVEPSKQQQSSTLSVIGPLPHNHALSLIVIYKWISFCTGWCILALYVLAYTTKRFSLICISSLVIVASRYRP